MVCNIKIKIWSTYIISMTKFSEFFLIEVDYDFFSNDI